MVSKRSSVAEAQRSYCAGDADRLNGLKAAYQLWHVALACDLQQWGRRAGLTSDKFEGLGHKLLAVLVVRHDCGGVSSAAGGGVAAMAGGRES